MITSSFLRRIKITTFVLLQLTAGFSQTEEEWRQKIEETVDSEQKVDYIIDLCTSISDGDSLLREAEKGIIIAKKIGYTKGQADLYNAQGIAYWRKQDIQQALNHYGKALKLRNKETEKLKISKEYRNSALCYLILAEYKNAIVYLNKAYEIQKQLNLPDELAKTKFNIGTAYYYQSKFDLAISSMIDALNYYETVNDTDSISSCYNNIGGLYLKIFKYDKAKHYFEKSYELDKKLGDTQAMSISAANIANINLTLGNYTEAIAQYKGVLRMDETKEDSLHYAEVLNGMGNAYKELEMYEESISHLLKSLHLKKERNLLNASIATLVSLSEVYYKMGLHGNQNESGQLFQNALKYALEALVISKQTESNLDQIEIYHQLYRCYKELHDTDKALDAFEKFKELNDERVNKDQHKQIAELESKYQLENKTRKIESLEADNQIKELKLKEQEIRVQTQRRLMITGITFFLMILLLVLLYWNWNKTRQQVIQNKLVIQNLKTEQKVFRSQMNPHFIYNSLNSIQAYISSNESYFAEKYLAKFAMLMRGILENSREEFVPLEKELSIIKAYLELEQLRFENRFSFEISFHPDFDHFQNIPPMLIQPFLENAIIHGFKNMSGGKLQIYFEEMEKTFICRIEDNGIGRIKSAKHKPQNKKSLATDICKKRLEILSKNTGLNCSLKIIDKDNDDQGTIVILTLPVIDSPRLT